MYTYTDTIPLVHGHPFKTLSSRLEASFITIVSQGRTESGSGGACAHGLWVQDANPKEVSRRRSFRSALVPSPLRSSKKYLHNTLGMVWSILEQLTGYSSTLSILTQNQFLRYTLDCCKKMNPIWNHCISATKTCPLMNLLSL